MYFQSVRDVGLIYFSPRQWFYQIACKYLRSHLSTVKRPRGSLVSSSSFVSFSMSLLNLQVLKPVEIEVTIYQSFSLQLLQQKVLGYIEAEGLNSESSCTRPIIRNQNHVNPRQAYISKLTSHCREDSIQIWQKHTVKPWCPQMQNSSSRFGHPRRVK